MSAMHKQAKHAATTDKALNGEFNDYPWRYWAKHAPQQCALRLDDGDVTWAEIVPKVAALASKLAALPPSQVIVASGENRVENLLLLLACAETHHVLLLLNPKLSDSEQQAALAQLGEFVWWSAIAPTSPSPGPDLFSDTPRPWQPDLPLSLTLTSGSTGIPKAVVHSAQTHLASACGLLQRMPFERHDQWLLSLPLFHISGLAIVWRWLMAGAQLRLSQLPLNHVLPTVTHASLVPTQLQRFLAEKPSHQLKQILLGGARIPVALVQAAAEHNIACWCGYGMTEMASTVTMKPADDSAGVGQLIPARELRLVDGEVWLRGHTLCLGYYRDNHVVPLTNAAGWFASRDLAEWREAPTTAQRELFVLGRSDNMFISGGENVQPEAIEQMLGTHPLVNQVMVLPVDDAEFGQRPVAVIDITGAEVDDWQPLLFDWCQSHLPGYQRPVAFYQWPSDVANGGIKASRAVMARWLREQRRH
uniref:o-succinylbenzoate--CoA ligase n=1 Tax=Thaumasiovibrio occultus TaxID=1891184 RepID=UPI000B34B6F9|nr:o-succinylbenzoate--CoA ligase [Thaumasiovibrio occultus]